MKIQILIDNPNSWIVPYAQKLIDKIKVIFNVNAQLFYKHNEVEKGDFLFLLACENVFRNLEYNSHNIVVHESDLPKGRGWSPVTWQVLEGKNEIPMTLFEAGSSIDSGKIYLQSKIELNGDELLKDIKHQQGEKTIELILTFLKEHDSLKGIEQKGEPSFYPKRGPEHSKLDINKTIQEQFNLFRVVDNERYPAYFMKNGKKYILKIYDEK